MADISKVNVNGVDYNVKDASTTEAVAAETTRATAAEQANAAAITAQGTKVSENTVALNGYKIIAAGTTARFFATTYAAGTQEVQTITIPFIGQSGYIVLFSLRIEGVGADGIWCRCVPVNNTSFNAVCNITKALPSGAVVKVMYMCIATS